MSSDERLSVLWLCGPPGAGKSAVGWAMYAGLARSGVRAGFVDIDQLGMCLPAPPDDPERYRLKARNLSAVAGNFRAAGCDAVVVSGHLGSSDISSLTAWGDSLTICRLRASADELRRRLTSRRAPDLVADSLREAERLDRSSFADACVDTDGLTVAEVARLVRERCGDWPPEPAAGDHAGAAAPVSGDEAARAATPAGGAGGEVLLVCGATGAGKSAVGFEVFLRQLRAGVSAAYIDLDQVGFVSPPLVPADDPGGHRLKALNLADLWPRYHEAGARLLVLSGPVPDARAAAVYAGTLPAGRLTLCRLHAGPAELAHRISLRGQGLGWPQPGDPLTGQPEAHLRLAAERAAADAEALERSGLGDLRIDTDGLSVSEAADLITAQVNWG
ncbi:MAG: AAA family ATPase [Actinobacteria bacterium]|nr:AAA family ATPase [Actinomycetota bacterium]